MSMPSVKSMSYKKLIFYPIILTLSCTVYCASNEQQSVPDQLPENQIFGEKLLDQQQPEVTEEQQPAAENKPQDNTDMADFQKKITSEVEKELNKNQDQDLSVPMDTLGQPITSPSLTSEPPKTIADEDVPILPEPTQIMTRDTSSEMNYIGMDNCDALEDNFKKIRCYTTKSARVEELISDLAVSNSQSENITTEDLGSKKELVDNLFVTMKFKESLMGPLNILLNQVVDNMQSVMLTDISDEQVKAIVVKNFEEYIRFIVMRQNNIIEEQLKREVMNSFSKDEIITLTGNMEEITKLSRSPLVVRFDQVSFNALSPQAMQDIRQETQNKIEEAIPKFKQNTINDLRKASLPVPKSLLL